MIAILLFRLLMIQMAIQFIMTAVLEGRTSHYVSLLDSPVDDSTAQRLTCPVYSIKPAGGMNRYTKYVASAAQSSLVIYWSQLNNIDSFNACASAASSDNKTMFKWDDGVCSVINSLFNRVPEPCNDETSTLVYMIDPPASSCVTEFLVLNDGDQLNYAICGGSATTMVSCISGKLFAYDSVNSKVFHDDGNGCFVMQDAGSNDHSQQATLCGSDQTCYPKSESEIPDFVEMLKQMAQLQLPASRYDTMIDLKRTSGTWKWGPSNVVQPVGSDRLEWSDGYPDLGGANAEYGYIEIFGIASGPMTGKGTAVCCYST